MKHTKFFIFALLAAMTFSACGTDDTCSSIFLKTVVLPVAVIRVVEAQVAEAQAAIPVVNQPIRTIQTRMWLLPTCHKW